MKPACIYPFSHIFIDSTGYVKPCCTWDSRDKEGWANIADTKATDAIQTERWKQVRSNMLQGKLDEVGCKKCIEIEKGGYSSPRVMRNRMEKNAGHFDGVNFNENTHQLTYLDTGFSSLCNLTCRMCFPGVSSSIFKAMHPNESVPMAYIDDLDNIDVNMEKLHEVKLVGGEPFYDPRHLQFLEKILDSSKQQIVVRYFTNATITPNKKVLALWKKLKGIILTLSLDGVEEVALKQRPGPYTWDNIVDNLNYFKSIAEEYNIKFAVSCTMSRINAPHHQRLIDFVGDTFGGEVESFSAFCLTTPTYLDIRSATDGEKEKLKNIAESWTHNVKHNSDDRWDNFIGLHKQNILNAISQNTNEDPALDRYDIMDVLDKKCNTNLRQEYYNTAVFK